MVDEQPPKKVVKRVVKRAAPPREPAIRYGRPVPETKQAPRAPLPKVPSKVSARDEPAPAPPTTPAGPKIGRPTLRRPTITAPRPVDLAPRIEAMRTRTSGVASTVGERAVRYGHATGDFAHRRWETVRGWRVPALAPLPASLVTGALVGLVSVALGVASLAMFTELRGVASGGGRWGSLTVVVVMFVAFALGELLLTAFGTASARLTSFLGVMLTVIAILGLFLGVADSRLGIVVVPLTAALAFAAARWLLDLAETTPAEPE